MTRDTDSQIDRAVSAEASRQLSKTDQRRVESRAWGRGIDVPVFLAHGRGEAVGQAPRSLKAPTVRFVSTPVIPRSANPDIALKPVRRALKLEEEKPKIRIPARTFPWQLEAVEAPLEYLQIRGATIRVVDMSSIGPLSGYAAKLVGSHDLSERADTLTRVSLEREFDEGLLFGGKILRSGKLGGESPIFALATDGPNEARKVGVWRTRISGDRRTIVVARGLYGDIEAVNRRLGFAGYKEPAPGSFGK